MYKPRSTINSAEMEEVCLNKFLHLFLLLLSKEFREYPFGDTQTSVWPRQVRVIPVPPQCTHASLYLIYPPTYPTDPNKSVPQMTVLMPLAEIPLFYPRTCGGKAERKGERERAETREGCRGKKNHFFIWPEKHLSFYVLAEVKSTWG